MQELNQTGRYISPVGFLEFNQYSQDVPLRVTYDDTYTGYEFIWRAGYDVMMSKSIILSYNHTSSVIKLPPEVLHDRGKVYLQFEAIRGSERVWSDVLEVSVNRSVNDPSINDPTGPDVVEVVQQYTDQIVDNKIIPKVEQITVDANQARDDAQAAAQTANQTFDDLKEFAEREEKDITNLADTKKEELSAHKIDLSNSLTNQADILTKEYNSNAVKVEDSLNNLSNNLSKSFNELHENASKEIVTATENLDVQAENLQNQFNLNADNKTRDYDANAAAMIISYDNNASAKTVAYNELTVAANQVIDDKVTIATEQANTATQAAQDLTDSTEIIRRHDTDITYMRDELDTKQTQPYISNSSTYIEDADYGLIRNLEIYGKTTQSTTIGAQLLGVTLKAVSRGVNITLNNGTLNMIGTVNGIDISSRVNAWIDPIGLEAGSTYTVSSSDSKISVSFVYYDSDGAVHFTTKNTYTVIGNEQKITVRAILGTTAQIEGQVINETSYIMLNEGAEALPWEPYTGGKASPNIEYPQEIKNIENPEITLCGANIFDINAPCNVAKLDGYVTNGVTFSVNADKSLTLSGDCTASSGYISTIMYNNISSKLQDGRTYLAASNTAFTIAKKDGSTYACQKFIANKETMTTVRIYIQPKVADYTPGMVLYPAVYCSDMTQAYAPYKGQTVKIQLAEPLRSVGGVHDTICQCNGEFGVLRKIKYYKFNGSESGWSLTTKTMDGLTFKYASMTVEKGKSQYNVSIMCSNAAPLAWSSVSPICFINEYKYFSFGGIGAGDLTTDLSNFKAYLAEHPIDLQYELETPIFEPFEDEIQEQLCVLATAYGVNNVLCNTGTNFKYKLNLPSWIEMVLEDSAEKDDVIYDLQTQVQQQEIVQLENALNADYRITLMEIGLGGGKL